jgi:uncharacterized protein
VTPAPAATLPDSSGRIAILDILRGFALFGMIFVHFHQNFRLSTPEATHTTVEHWIGMFAWMGVEQKSWGTFAFLFGVGFAVLMRRAERRGDAVVALYLRRLGALALVGVALDAFTGFTILLDYALWGVPLLFIRKWPTTVLLLVAVLSASAWTIKPLATTVHDWATLGREGADQAMEARSKQAGAAFAAARPAPPTNYREFVVHQLRMIQRRFSNWQGLLPTSSFALFIVGMLAVRRGVFDEPRRHTRLIVTFMAIGLASWIGYWWVLALVPTGFAPQMVGMLLREGFGIVSDQWLAFTYIGALVLLLTYRPQWTQRLALFGTAGRMALTNYVLQCVVIFLLSSPFAFGLHLSPYYYALGAILLFSATVLVSRAWLSRFLYGPLEWMWRSVTYLRIPPLRRFPVSDAGLTPV